MKKQKNRLLAIFVSSAVIFLGGCYPDEPEYIEDFDLVVTKHDDDFDFQSVGTYAIPDQVVKITGNLIDSEQEIEFVNDVYAETILASIRENMQNYGWTEVSKDADPDVIILPSAMSSTTFVWYYYDYWNWWYPYYYWGWYYPYAVYGGSYTSGSVFVQMTHPAGMTAADNIPVVWSSILNGLLEGSTTGINARIDKSINQAFTQSPYLNHSNN